MNKGRKMQNREELMISRREQMQNKLNVNLTKKMSTFVTLTDKMSIFPGARSSPREAGQYDELQDQWNGPDFFLKKSYLRPR